MLNIVFYTQKNNKNTLVAYKDIHMAQNTIIILSKWNLKYISQIGDTKPLRIFL